MRGYLPLIFAGLAVVGCSKSAPAPTPVPIPYTVGWTSDGIVLSTQGWLTSSGGVGNGQLGMPTIWVAGRIREGGNAGTAVELEMPPAVGTYVFGPTSPAWGTYQVNAVKYYAGTAPGITGAPGSGSITVTKLTSGTINGTFIFTGVNPATGATKTIANGTFYVPK